MSSGRRRIHELAVLTDRSAAAAAAAAAEGGHGLLSSRRPGRGAAAAAATATLVGPKYSRRCAVAPRACRRPPGAAWPAARGYPPV